MTDQIQDGIAGVADQLGSASEQEKLLALASLLHRLADASPRVRQPTEEDLVVQNEIRTLRARRAELEDKLGQAEHELGQARLEVKHWQGRYEKLDERFSEANELASTSQAAYQRLEKELAKRDSRIAALERDSKRAEYQPAVDHDARLTEERGLRQEAEQQLRLRTGELEEERAASQARLDELRAELAEERNREDGLGRSLDGLQAVLCGGKYPLLKPDQVFDRARVVEVGKALVAFAAAFQRLDGDVILPTWKKFLDDNANMHAIRKRYEGKVWSGLLTECLASDTPVGAAGVQMRLDTAYKFLCALAIAGETTVGKVSDLIVEYISERDASIRLRDWINNRHGHELVGQRVREAYAKSLKTAFERS